MPKQLPSGPRSRALTTVSVMLDGLGSPERWQKRYGDPFYVRSVNGDLVMTGRADLIGEIFRGDPDIHEVFGLDAVTTLLGEASLLARTGPDHRRQRKLLIPPFMASRMEGYGDAMAKATIDRLAALPVGSEWSALDVTHAISLDVIIRAIIGVEEPQRVEQFRTAVKESIDAVHPAFLFAPFMRRSFGGVGPWAEYQRKLLALEALFQEQIERVRPRADEREDILSRMITLRYEDGTAMTDLELRSHLRTLLSAGYETTGIALAWALYYVLSNARVALELRRELDAVGPEPDPKTLAALPYLQAVCQETLRIQPIVPEVMRKLAAPIEFAGYEVPAGTSLCASISLAHWNERIYPQPAAFRPERFLERKFSPFEYLPFGGGARRCLGAAFALHEMAVVLGTLLSRYDLVLRERRKPRAVRRNVTLAPKGGVRLQLTGRR